MKFNEPKLGIESEAHKGIRISDYIEPRMNSISLVSILVGFAYSGVIGFMAAYTKDLDLIMAGKKCNTECDDKIITKTMKHQDT